MTTGEDMPAGHASLVARSLIINVPRHRLDTARGSRCLSHCKDYPAITARYIRFLLRRHNFRVELNSIVHKYRERFLREIAREDNAARLARNLALNLVGFRYFTRFLRAIKAGFDVDEMRVEHRRILFALRDQMLDLINKENPGGVFLRTISEALASGRARLKETVPTRTQHGGIVIGFDQDSKDGLVSIFPGESMAFVREQEWRAGREFDWTPNAVSKQLISLGALVKRQDRKDAGTTVRYQGKVQRVWLVRTRHLGIQTGHPSDDEEDVT